MERAGWAAAPLPFGVAHPLRSRKGWRPLDFAPPLSAMRNHTQLCTDFGEQVKIIRSFMRNEGFRSEACGNWGQVIRLRREQGTPKFSSASKGAATRPSLLGRRSRRRHLVSAQEVTLGCAGTSIKSGSVVRLSTSDVLWASPASSVSGLSTNTIANLPAEIDFGYENELSYLATRP